MIPVYQSVEAVKSLILGDPRVCGATRSSGWSKVRDTHIAAFPCCAVCGYRKYLNVHHIRPFHLYPALELDPTNLITLGERCPTGNHHLFVGHLGTWASYNIHVTHDAFYWLQKIKERP